jgi:hypothetical protein
MVVDKERLIGKSGGLRRRRSTRGRWTLNFLNPLAEPSDERISYSAVGCFFDQNGLGYILGVFPQTHLATLVWTHNGRLQASGVFQVAAVLVDEPLRGADPPTHGADARFQARSGAFWKPSIFSFICKF